MISSNSHFYETFCPEGRPRLEPYISYINDSLVEVFANVFTDIFAEVCADVFADAFADFFGAIFADLFADLYTDECTDVGGAADECFGE